MASNEEDFDQPAQLACVTGGKEFREKMKELATQTGLYLDEKRKNVCESKETTSQCRFQGTGGGEQL